MNIDKTEPTTPYLLNGFDRNEAVELTKGAYSEEIIAILREIHDAAERGETRIRVNSPRINDVIIETLRSKGFTVVEFGGSKAHIHWL